MEFETVYSRAEAQDSVPIYCVSKTEALDDIADLSGLAGSWAVAHNFNASAGDVVVLPDADGGLAGVLFGLGHGDEGKPSGGSIWLAGQLARALPAETYKFANLGDSIGDATLAWGLGAYRFDRYKGGEDKPRPQLVISDGVDLDELQSTVEAVWLGRDLINTPACDLGPSDMEHHARMLAEKFGADINVIVGEELLEQNFPMIHAVGRASDRAPRLIDLRWSPATSGGAKQSARKKVTLVGKGICFDTGGLNIKVGAGMTLMKKDMGGAATALVLGAMIMAQQLPVDLRILIPTAENNIAGNAFRPSDVLSSRSGQTVEIGNTDAEGRLVLADALTYADEEKPDFLISLATLTGAARVALGPDLPAFYCDDESFAKAAHKHGVARADPIWRMPFWAGYDKSISGSVANVSNTSSMPFAGSITAALFLNRFVTSAHCFAHVDLYGWRPANAPLGCKGGEPHSARGLFAALKEELSV